MKKNQKQGGIRTAAPRIAGYMKSQMGILIVALVLAALSAVLTIIGPDKIGRMATIMSDGLFTGIDLGAIAQVGIFLAVIYLLSALFGFTQHYIMSVVTLKMSYKMRGELSAKINRVPQKYFNTTSQGDVLSRITNDVSTLHRVAAGADLFRGHAGGDGADGAHSFQIPAVLRRPAEELG